MPDTDHEPQAEQPDTDHEPQAEQPDTDHEPQAEQPDTDHEPQAEQPDTEAGPHTTGEAPPEGSPELVMDELRDLRNKQDRQLDGMRRLGASALLVVLTTGTIAVAVNADLAAAAAVIILGGSLLIGLGLVAIELLASGWSAGPKIKPLIRQLREEPTLLDLQLVIIKGLRTDHAGNEKRLSWIKVVVFSQALCAAGAITTLLLGFRELL